jgi:hypothetical protein
LQVKERDIRLVFSELIDCFVSIGRFRYELHIALICGQCLYAVAQHGVIVG